MARTAHSILRALLQAAPVAPLAASTARRRGNQIRWGGQQFSSPGELVAWINAHGGQTSVPDFLARHPGAAAIFSGAASSNYAGAGAGPGIPALSASAGGQFQAPSGSLSHQLSGPIALPLPLTQPRFLGPPIQQGPRLLGSPVTQGGPRFLGPPVKRKRSALRELVGY